MTQEQRIEFVTALIEAGRISVKSVEEITAQVAALTERSEIYARDAICINACNHDAACYARVMVDGVSKCECR